MNDRATHPMGVVTRRTGLRPEVIRAWERRHRAIEPSRTPGNHRLYTDGDIDRLRLIRRALDSGFQIGNVASLPDAQIERLIEGGVGTPPRRAEAARDGKRIAEHLQACLDRIVALDGEGLERQFESASIELSRVELLERLLVPLMNAVGNACAEGRCRIANEHLATAVARSFLDSMRGAFPASDTDPCIVVTTPLHQHHELAAMIVAGTARSEGWRTSYLGSNLPAEEIAAAIRQCRARAAALSITWPRDDADLDRDLAKLGRLLPDDVLLIVGGRGAEGYRDTLDGIGAKRPADLNAFRALLEQARAGASRASG